MLLLLLTTIAFSQAASPVTAPREWRGGDEGVRFVEGTTSPPIQSLPEWRGERAEISVRCIVRADGGLDDCAVVRESPPRALWRQSARAAVGRMRLLLGEDGPAPGDGFTIDVVVTRN
jgi:hypothetical protein